MITIPLTKGQVTIVDDCDADLLSYAWHAMFIKNRQKYCATRRQKVMFKYKTTYMHRVILSRMLGRELQKYEQVDHKDLNPLNNCRENLRLANNGQNQQNSQKYENNTSGFKGVSWHKATNKWRSSIQVVNKQMHLGLFTNIEDAAKAYQEAAIKYHGEFARWTEVENGEC